MNKKELEEQLEETHQRFIELVNSIPEEKFSLPSDNPAWTVGDILFHITLGPQALALEIWMLINARGVFQWSMKHFPSGLFNSINAWFGRRGRVSRQGLLKAYGKGHSAVLSVLRRMQEEDLSTTVEYPADFVSDLAGEVTPERLIRYVTGHFEEHEGQLRRDSLV